MKVGGAIGRRAIERGIVTREQLLPGSPVTDVVTLPEPTDIQVATAWPQVQAYRAAAITAGKAAYAAEVQHRYLDDTRRRIPDDTPTHRKIRQEAYLRYRAAADEHDKALNAMAAAETAAQEVAPAATRRAQLTQDAYSARLHGERQADLQRRGLDE
ncbi:hypothetical protein [Actinomadura madurae]|uniref:hypothetical protein n=1 Tax=Actinomadura madurae TaxID=1993 RepID=UPI0020D1FD74|nr:hypothetical protein [Actinomadura madurae]MCQ0011917.1 hypothetical protein [Actinomadura madurae]